MARRGAGYGSEDHLRRYLALHVDVLNDEITKASGVQSNGITWRPFPETTTGDRELRELEFLDQDEHRHVIAAWQELWPRTGRPITWDTVGRTGDTWLLIEAKANWPEFVTGPSGAGKASLKRIDHAMDRIKRDLGVHRRFSWSGTSYYQHANRLLLVWFLQQHNIGARLVDLFFLGDVFPDGTPCPRSKADWCKLVGARRLTLGIPETADLRRLECQAFLPALVSS